MMRRYRGTTLTELLIVLAVSGPVFGAGVSVIHKMLAFDRRIRQEVEMRQTLVRLARTWRDDIHHSTTVELEQLEPDNHQLKDSEPHATQVLTLSSNSEGTISYFVQENVCQLTRTAIGGVSRHDEFRLPSEWTIQIQRFSNDEWLRLCVWPTDVLQPVEADNDFPALATKATLILEAKIGRDHPFLSRGADI